MKNKVIESLKSVISSTHKIDFEKLIETPKDNKNGDFAFPCFVLAKALKSSPVKIAEDLVKKIDKKGFKKIVSVGPYINFFVDRKKLAKEIILKIEKEEESFGKSNLGKGQKTMVEFSQPNTHKAFHVGHIRGTSIGESLARIFTFMGDKVIRANYSGDTGMHIAKWIWCYKKYHAKEELKNDESWIAGIYVDSIKKLAKKEEFQKEVDEINKKLETKEDSEINEIWEKTRELSINSWKRIYEELNTFFDVHFFESEVEQDGKKISKKLVERKIAEISDGATIIKFDDENLGVWVLLRKDDTALYSAKDIALAEKKFNEFKIDKNIYVIGAAQSHHMKQLFKTLELMKFKQVEKCTHIAFAEVKLPEGKMSSRTGNNILYSDFMKEITDYTKNRIKEKSTDIEEKELEKRSLAVSIAAIKYSMLKQNSSRGITFDKKEALNFEGDTGPYLLYSYARASSILRKKEAAKFSISESLEEKEVELILRLNEFKEICESAYKNMSPALIANYSYKLAQIFNEFYHTCPVIGSKQEKFRLNLVKSFRQVLKNSLALLGIDTLESM